MPAFTIIAVRHGFLGYDDIELGNYLDPDTAISVALHYWRRRGGKYGVLVTRPGQWLYISSSQQEHFPVLRDE